MIPRGERRLVGLDGTRGLAALFVVVNHIFLSAFPGHLVDRAPFWAGWAIYGRFALVVFIVLVVYELIVAPWVRHGVVAFVLTLALVVPLTIVFARVFASVFETPFRQRAGLSNRRRGGRGRTGPSGR